MELFRVSKDFVTIVAPLTLSRYRRVRLTAIQALKQLIYCGAHEMILELVGFQDPNVLSIKVL